MCCVLQAFRALQHAAESVLAVLTKSPLLAVKSSTFSQMIDDHVLGPGQRSSSTLDTIQYINTQQQSGCPPHTDKGLLTLITADIKGLEVIVVIKHTSRRHPYKLLVN